jgi:Rad3-related DNA helicase
MNFSSFLYQTHHTDRFGKRELLIIDEAHQCESQIMDFVSVSINDLPFLDHGIQLPKSENPYEYAVWIHDHDIVGIVGSMVAAARNDKNLDKEDEYNELYNKLKRFMQCMSDGMADWVCEYRETKIGSQRIRTATMKPVFVSPFVPQLLFGSGQKVLLMSATILDHRIMCKSLGIKSDEVAFCRMKNYFPKQNRPIYLKLAGKFTGGATKMVEWGPKLVRAVDDIVAKYPNDRGIIHTHNFAIANLIIDNSKIKSRLFYQKDFRSKDLMLQEHARSKNGIIIAPAMHEGLDLFGDLSRFQIICKVPWPNFFEDKQLARRLEVDRSFILWLVAQKLVQSYGRSIRSESDWAHTYIIDGAITSFMAEANKMLPDWFKEAIIKGD